MKYFLGLIIIMFWLLGLLTSNNLPGFIEIIIMLMIITSTDKVIRKKSFLVEKLKS
jgi:hypothetical protein